jgi:hypothetical protein
MTDIGKISDPEPIGSSTADQLSLALSGLFDAAVSWKVIENDLALLIHIFYGLSVRLARRGPEIRRLFIEELKQSLVALPEGRRIAGLLRDLDRDWGSPLESAGLNLSEIAQRRTEGS